VGKRVSTIIFEPKEVRRIRSQLGITQNELAKEAGVSQSLIAKIEAGTIDPSFSTMARITLALRKRINSQGKKVKEIMSKPVISVQPNTPIRRCVELMKEMGISQLPVIVNERPVGSITETQILSLLGSSQNPQLLLDKPVSSYMQESFPQVGADTPVDAVTLLLSFFPAVLVVSEEKVEGIVTKIDIISARSGIV
jgi:predicted transcriptional regulator